MIWEEGSRGRGGCHGAVSILNGIATGIGATLAVDLEMTATAEVVMGETTLRREDGDTQIDALSDSIVRMVGAESGVAFQTWTNIPPRVGLKSSSAAAVAMLLALADAVDAEWSLEEIMQMAVDASLNSGLSITGALDDICGVSLSGIQLADNSARVRLLSEPAPSISVVIAVPRHEVATSSVNRADYANYANLYRGAEGLARDGDWNGALELNGMITATLCGLDTSTLLQARRWGADAVGVSGTGPAVFALADPTRAGELRNKMEAEWADWCSTAIEASPRVGRAWRGSPE